MDVSTLWFGFGLSSAVSTNLYFVSETALKPRFYNLSPASYSNQDTPKIDGLVRTYFSSHITHAQGRAHIK